MHTWYQLKVVTYCTFGSTYGPWNMQMAVKKKVDALGRLQTSLYNLHTNPTVIYDGKQCFVH